LKKIVLTNTECAIKVAISKQNDIFTSIQNPDQPAQQPYDKTNIVRLRPAWIQTSKRIRAGSMLFAYRPYYK
jgi:hypothetical protein